MKKTLALFLAIVLICGSLIACSGFKYANSPVVGTWKMKKSIEDGATVDASQLNSDADKVLKLNANGKAMIRDGMTSIEGIPWEFEENVVRVWIDDSKTRDYVFDGKTLTFEQSGVKMIFEKQK